MNIDLTHPEILTIEQLQRFVGSEDIDDRYELIQLFYKYVAPLPQRKFRSNRWGTLLTESQRQIRGEKSTTPMDIETTEKTSQSVIQQTVVRVNSQSQGEKHESDRGIYTVTLHQSPKKNTAPIKLKRSSLEPTSDDHQKRPKIDSTPT